MPRDTTSLRSIRTTGNETVCFPEMETKPREVVVLGFVDNTALVKKGPNGITSLLPLSFQMYTSITQESFFLTSGIRTCILSATVGNMSLVRFRTPILEARFSEYGCQTPFVH